MKPWRERYPLRAKSIQLKWKFGITLKQYYEMRRSQDGRCAICGSRNPKKKGAKHLAVDHDHNTGMVRKLLCGHCNKGLGYFRDNPEFLDAAARYIREHS